MAIPRGIEPSTDAAILTRLVCPGQGDCSPEAATALLSLQFDRADRDRMHELVLKNQDEALTDQERSELESYLRVSCFLDLLHAKASRSLGSHSQVTE